MNLELNATQLPEELENDAILTKNVNYIFIKIFIIQKLDSSRKAFTSFILPSQLATPASIYLFKVNIGNTRTVLIIKTQKRR